MGSPKYAWLDVLSGILIIFAGFRFLNRGANALGLTIIIVGIAFIVYGAYKYISNKETDAKIAGTIAVVAILLIAGALLINPAAKEEIENGGDTI